MKRTTGFRVLAALAAVLVGGAASGAAGAADDPHVAAVVRASRAAQHLDALARITTIHLHGAENVVGVLGTGDNWQDVRSGSFAQYTDAGPLSGATGFDGTHAWNRDASGVVWDDGGAAARYAAIDAVYMNRFALWSPDRGGAAVVSTGTSTEKGHGYDVLRITPRGGLPFDLWIDAASHLPAKTIATIGTTTFVQTYGDYRNISGVRIPFVQNTETNGDLVTFTAASATAGDAAAAAALRRPVMHVEDFSLPNGSTAIPFELVDNHVDLAVTINGKGPFQFLFDTGGSNIIDAEVAKALGLKAAGNASASGVGAATESFQFATVDALGVGGATLRNQVFAIAPVRAGFGMSSSKPVDGLIGFEVLARFVTTFDYGTNTVVLRTPGAPVAPGGTTIPFAFNGQHVQVPCTIASFPGRCTVDTGSRVALSVLSPFLAAHPPIVPATATAVGANGYGVGGASLGRLGRTTLEIAGYTIPDLITDLSEQKKGSFADPFTAGNIGAGVLKRFAVTFDYGRQTMTLAPNASFATRDSYDRSGLFLIGRGGKILVADVRPGTPAAESGIAKGDTIVTAGGANAVTLGVGGMRDLLRGAAGTAVPLTVSGKDGTPRSVTVTLRDYV
jgi:hypothetical protein